MNVIYRIPHVRHGVHLRQVELTAGFADSGRRSEFAALERLFDARCLAVIGASADTDKIGGRPLRYLQASGFEGAVHPVNPRYDEILGRRCSPSVFAIGEAVDVAILAVPQSKVEAAIDDCAAASVPFAVVFSSGFAETGDEGRRRQRALVERARAGGVRLVGPNSLGIASSPNGLMASFATLFDRHPRLIAGSVGFISQSGALGAFIYAIAQDDGFGFSRFVSIGNEADLDVADFLAFMARDSATTAIGGYLEGLGDGRRFLDAADLARQAGKPMAFLKVGRSESGRRAAESHTGSLTGSDAVYDAAFKQVGIVRATDPQGLVDLLRHQGSSGVPPARRGVGVLTISGGAGVWCADRLADAGVDLATLSQATLERLVDLLPPFASPQNPVDATGQVVNDPTMFTACLDALLDDPCVGVLLVVLGLQERSGDSFALELAAAHQRRPTTAIVVAWLAGPASAMESLASASIPVYNDLARAVDVVASSILVTDGLKVAALPTMPERSAEPVALPPVDTEHASKRFVASLGVEVPPGVLCGSVDEALAVAGLGSPVALKAQVKGMAHKTEHGLVVLDVQGDEAVRAAYAHVHAAALTAGGRERLTGVLVERMAPAGVDVIIGCSHDDVFGPTVMFGLGGTLVELIGDVSFRVAPVTVEQALEMVDDTRGAQLLDGYRGTPRCDRLALGELISLLSHEACLQRHVIREIELNPVRVHPGGAMALDALIVLHEMQP